MAEYLEDAVDGFGNGYLKCYDFDEDGKFDSVNVTCFSENYVVESIDISNKTLKDVYGGNIPIFLNDEYTKFTFKFSDGSAARFDDIEKDNIISFAESRDESLITVWISDLIVSGIVTSEERGYNDISLYVINENIYKAAKEISVRVADEGEFYINADNEIVYKKVETNKNYAYLYKAAFLNGIDNGVQVKFITANGDWKVLELANKVTVYKDIAGFYDYEIIESAKAYSDLGLWIK